MTTERKGDAQVTKQPTPKPTPTPDQEQKGSAATTKPTQQLSQTPTPADTSASATTGHHPAISHPSSASQSPVTRESAHGHGSQVAKGVQKQEAAATSTLSLSDSQPRQVIAVSASKNPAAFFNLARRFLVTDEYCDLSALEGAIVSAVDAAHLLERSKLAHIVRYVMYTKCSLNLFLDDLSKFKSFRTRTVCICFEFASSHSASNIFFFALHVHGSIQTSYVTVEPRSKSTGLVSDVTPARVAMSDAAQTSTSSMPIPTPQHLHQHPMHPRPHQTHEQTPQKPHHGKKGNPLRRSRIIITVKRTEEYKAWLKENEDEGDKSTPPPAS
jgi:hypothetical protein